LQLASNFLIFLEIADFKKILGLGNFGTVYQGTAKGDPAAIKKPRTNCGKSAFTGALSEVNVLCYIGIHPNVIHFIGAYIKEIKEGMKQKGV